REQWADARTAAGAEPWPAGRIAGRDVMPVKARPRTGLNAHKMVANVAIEMANEMFEVYALENAFYRKLRADGAIMEKQARLVFVERVAPRMLEDARQTLSSMLGTESTSDYVKEQIYEALCLDSDLRANRFVAADQASIPSVLH
ncbi:MAG TPA: hypothetical protein VHA37_07735, partial [Candidatus Saccharimonadales bacterium]|nr:hypothetical protein [Candidatus Saccharimonadales bacterium]